MKKFLVPVLFVFFLFCLAGNALAEVSQHQHFDWEQKKDSPRPAMSKNPLRSSRMTNETTDRDLIPGNSPASIHQNPSEISDQEYEVVTDKQRMKLFCLALEQSFPNIQLYEIYQDVGKKVLLRRLRDGKEIEVPFSNDLVKKLSNLKRDELDYWQLCRLQRERIDSLMQRTKPAKPDNYNEPKCDFRMEEEISIRIRCPGPPTPPPNFFEVVQMYTYGVSPGSVGSRMASGQVQIIFYNGYPPDPQSFEAAVNRAKWLWLNRCQYANCLNCMGQIHPPTPGRFQRR